VTLSDATKQQLNAVSTATLTSQLLKRGFRNTFVSGCVPLCPHLRLLGYAFTLRYAPAREDLDVQVDFDNDTNVQRLAVEAIGQDEVLVIDARGELRAASFGHILMTRIKIRGAAGLVTDGALRDTPAIARLELPSYCRGAHATTSAVIHHPADMNVPIGCGGVLVMPGDVVVGDAEGVVIIPRAHAEDIAAAAYAQERLEEFVTGKVAGGAGIRGLYPPSDDVLEEFDARDPR
jgi:regulator of RNase E activity RraA